MLDGIRINSPFYLAKLKIPKTDQVERYTLVVSEYEKTHDITFTIEGKFKNFFIPFESWFRIDETLGSESEQVFANIQFHLEYLKKLPVSKRITGEWTRDTAGGCANYRDTTNKNPIHLIQIDRPTEYIAELRAPKEYSGNFQILIRNTFCSVVFYSEPLLNFSIIIGFLSVMGTI